MKMQMVFGKLLLELILILDYALVHEQKQHFIRGRENLTGGGKWGRWGGKWREKGGSGN